MSDHTVIVALDFPSADDALLLLNQLDPTLCAVKVGFELYIAAGPALLEEIHKRGFRVFLDLKLHDIPNTVASACRAAARLGVWMVNVHAMGGPAMMLAAREALDKERSQTYLLAVTVLTSHDQPGLAQIGLELPLADLVLRYAHQAAQSGANGVVCSAQEASFLRNAMSHGFLLVTPGIRLSDGQADDQKRIVTPADAACAGVDHIVVGRPISRSANPAIALERFYQQFVS